MIAADTRPIAFVIWTLGLLAYYAYVDDFGKSFPKFISNEQLAKRITIWAVVVIIIVLLK